MRWGWLAALSLPLLLLGCQPPPPTVFVMLEAGKVVFHIRDHADLVGKIFGWDDEDYAIEHFLITSRGRPIAGLSPGRTGAPCSRSITFPLTLGEGRCRYAWLGKARALPPGSYEVRLASRKVPGGRSCPNGDCRVDQWWSGSSIGAFVVEPGGDVVNVRPEKAIDECGASNAAYSAVYQEVADACLPPAQH
jgi:hypothetical protein